MHDNENLYSCPIEIINGLTDNGHFQHFTGLKGPQKRTYLYVTQFLSLTKDKYQYFIRKYLNHLLRPPSMSYSPYKD